MFGDTEHVSSYRDEQWLECFLGALVFATLGCLGLLIYTFSMPL